jgi:radical SAM protein (TIGR01212 family)
MNCLPYRSLSSYVRERFGAGVIKIPVDAGFSCPNRDGTIGSGGCTFCANESFSPPARRARRPLAEQIASARAAHLRRRPGARFWIYFQPFTNTHGPLAFLQAAWAEALLPDVVALSVGTRPDCVPDPVLDLLVSCAGPREVWLELGLQSANDETLRRIRRGHTAGDFADAARRAAGFGLHVLAHVILGLPGETDRDVRGTAAFLAGLPVRGVKVHHLYVAKGTALEEEYRRGSVPVLEPGEYARLAADFLERLPPDVVVHRLVSDPEPDLLVAPVWNVSKAEVLRGIADELARRGTRQGALAAEGGGGGGRGE